MLTFYIISGVVGLALIVMSLFGGEGHGHDHDISNGHGVDVSHPEAAQPGDSHGTEGAGPWIPFFSIRFWTYFFGAFGLCGVLLSLLIKTPEPMAAMMSGGTGLVIGLIVSYSMRLLQKSNLDSSVSPAELMGKEAQVVVALRPGQIGRVRLSVKGEILELLATCDEPISMEMGSFAVIVDMDGDRVKVVSRETVYGNAETLNA
jgi:membrane protein implicated in regulation of membrane protease activity